MNWNGSGVSWRLFDMELCKLVGPLESRSKADKRHTSWTCGKRDAMTNWLRFKVVSVPMSRDNPCIIHDYWDFPTRYSKFFKLPAKGTQLPIWKSVA